MTSIIYKIVAGFGESIGFYGDGSPNVRIGIDGIESGSIVIGSCAARIQSGVSHIDLSELSDGEYTPTLFASSKRIPLEKIRVRGGKVSKVILDPALIERLASRVGELEAAQEKLLLRLDALEIATHPKTLF